MATKIYWQKFRRVIGFDTFSFFALLWVQQSMSRGSHYVAGRGPAIVQGNHQDCPDSYIVAWIFKIALVHMIARAHMNSWLHIMVQGRERYLS